MSGIITVDHFFVSSASAGVTKERVGLRREGIQVSEEQLQQSLALTLADANEEFGVTDFTPASREAMEALFLESHGVFSDDDLEPVETGTESGGVTAELPQ